MLASLRGADDALVLCAGGLPGQLQDKLSQNRSCADVDGVVAGLTARGDDASARAVQGARRRPAS